jgi:GTP-binding protein EngB required for normal cell division
MLECILRTLTQALNIDQVKNQHLNTNSKLPDSIKTKQDKLSQQKQKKKEKQVNGFIKKEAHEASGYRDSVLTMNYSL